MSLLFLCFNVVCIIKLNEALISSMVEFMNCWILDWLFRILCLQLSRNFSTAPGNKDVKVKVIKLFGFNTLLDLPHIINYKKTIFLGFLYIEKPQMLVNLQGLQTSIKFLDIFLFFLVSCIKFWIAFNLTISVLCFVLLDALVKLDSAFKFCLGV